MTQLGNIYAILALIFGSLLAIGIGILKVFNAGKDNQRVQDMQQQQKDEKGVDDALDKAIQADTVVRNDIANGRLHDDDGHKRPG
jgi:hypothetical protein